MQFIRYITLFFGLMVAACSAVSSVGPWDGEYRFSGLGGETGGGSPIMMDITLTIKNSASNASCSLNATGYQTFDRIICSTTDKGSKLEVKFKSYDDGKILYGDDKIEQYKVGQVLFVLEKVQGEDNITRYVPHWAAYVPFDNMDVGGKYVFKKTK